jgi:hypothetical protein
MRLRQLIGGTALAAGSWLVCAGLAAQELELRGRVVDADSDASVVGAMVIALDAAAAARARTLTDDDGDFILRVPAGVEVRGFQVVRIGYASQEYAADALSPSRPGVLRVASSPVELEGIGVVADDLCGQHFEGSGQVYDIWLETRKALEMTRLTQTERTLSFDSETISRVLDPVGLTERERRVVPRQLRGRTPYYSLTEEQMAEIGWVATADDGSLRYWAPDATALLSSTFEEQHCFGAELTEDRIVLRFAPNRARQTVPDIEGEVILDRTSHRLERLRFDYTSLPLPREASGHAGGEVHFLGAPNGMWVVSAWWIRMPVVTVVWEQNTVRAFQRARVDEIREEGGRVLRIHTGAAVIDVTVPPPA